MLIISVPLDWWLRGLPRETGAGGAGRGSIPRLGTTRFPPLTPAASIQWLLLLITEKTIPELLCGQWKNGVTGEQVRVTALFFPFCNSEILNGAFVKNFEIKFFSKNLFLLSNLFSTSQLMYKNAIFDKNYVCMKKYWTITVFVELIL